MQKEEVTSELKFPYLAKIHFVIINLIVVGDFGDYNEEHLVFA